MKRSIAQLLVFAMLLAMMTVTLTGCASSKWQGEWNRTGDATYSRAVMEIYDVSRKGFTFDMDLYNGNVVGELEGCYALFMDRSCTEAVYDVPNTYANITFTMNEKGEIDVFYMGGTGSSNYILEAEAFEFDEVAYITGNFVRGKTTYLNSSFEATGMLTAEGDKLVRDIMPEDMYIRCLDCFQYWRLGNEKDKTLGKHNDLIGGFVYYGWNQMQEMGGVIIVFDDNSVAVILERGDETLVYYSDNHIYGKGDVYPLPIQIWMEDYYEMLAKIELENSRPQI